MTGADAWRVLAECVGPLGGIALAVAGMALLHWIERRGPWAVRR